MFFFKMTEIYQFIGMIRNFNENFGDYSWSNPTKARQLVNISDNITTRHTTRAIFITRMNRKILLISTHVARFKWIMYSFSKTLSLKRFLLLRLPSKELVWPSPFLPWFFMLKEVPAVTASSLFSNSFSSNETSEAFRLATSLESDTGTMLLIDLSISKGRRGKRGRREERVWGWEGGWWFFLQ